MTTAPNTTRLKQTWSDGGAALGLWVSSDSGSSAEVLALQDVDYLNIDMQHGVVDYSGAVDVMRALSATDATITCRVPWNEPGIIGKVLDAGAMGVIIPMVNTVEQAEAAVAACRYAPLGSRSHGPIRAAHVNGPDYPATANARVACIPMIETTEAMSNLDAILDVPGIDAVYVGPADLSLTLGLPPAGDHDDPKFQDALDTIVAACTERGIVAGIHANPGLTQKRLVQGFRMVTVSSDLLSLASGLSADLAAGRSADGATGDGALY
ncbi:MAG: aldolase/citrate lyase family protein [Ilumatobacter sp.]|uniref:HpcH/HpaI aldolase family protein n=1 Tax=Ilumatobacter sp. TaxID=1967498 RepID=UPI003C77F4F1